MTVAVPHSGLADELRTTIARQRPNLNRLAHASGVARGTLYHLIQGTHAVRESTLRRIAAGLQVVLASPDPAALPSAAVERLRAEVAYAASFDKRTARERAEVVASELLDRVSAIKDLPYVRDQVAENLRATIRSTAGDEAAVAQLGLARVLLESGEYEETLRLTAPLRALQGERRYVANWIAAEALRMLGRWDEGLAALRTSLKSRDPVVRAWAHWNKGKIDDKLGRYDTARSAYRRAIEIAGSNDVPDWEGRDIRGWSHWALGWTALRTTTPDDALASFREAARIGPAGDAGLQLWVSHGLAQLLATVGDIEEARDIYEAGIPLAHAIRNEHYTGWMYSGLAQLALTQGAYTAAVTWAEEAAIVYAKRVGVDAPSRAFAQATAEFARGASGARGWTRVVELLDDLAGRSGSYRYVNAAVGLLACEARRLAGDLTGAARRAAGLVELTASSALGLQSASARLLQATIAIQRTASSKTQPSERAAGLRALRDARRGFESRQAAWGISRALMLAVSAGIPTDRDRLRTLVRGRYPLEAAELPLLSRGTVPRTPLTFGGD